MPVVPSPPYWFEHLATMAASSNYADVLVFTGTLIHTKVFGELEIMKDRVIVVEKRSGKIAELASVNELDAVLASFGADPAAVTALKEGQFFVPGFIDTHVHAPQYLFTGTGTELQLFEWLNTYTFPAESTLKDLGMARRCYTALIDRLLKNGTTTCVYYATLHLEPTVLLADLLEELGQRAIVGKVSMDRNSPDHYVSESCALDLEHTETFLKHCKTKGCSRVMPSVVPRFIPTCSVEMLKGCAELAKKYDAYIQSHISESIQEVAFQKEFHPEYSHDTEMFYDLGLLTNKSIMAHGTFCGNGELDKIAEVGATIAHCPYSNFFLGDGMFRVRHAVERGVKVGLGSDIAGGIHPSLLQSMRAAVVNARALRAHKLAMGTPLEEAEEDLISFKEAFWLATYGGALSLSLEDKIGCFEVGKEFDALLVDTTTNVNFDIFDHEGIVHRFEKFINLGDDRNILAVYVQGKQVKSVKV